MLKANSTECSGPSREEIFNDYLPTVDDCAFACKGVSKHFVFGTGTFSNDKCFGGRCKCFCETATPCDQETSDYGLYKFKTGNMLYILFWLRSIYIGCTKTRLLMYND